MRLICYFSIFFLSTLMASQPKLSVLVARSLNQIKIEGLNVSSSNQLINKNVNYSGFKRFVFDCKKHLSKVAVNQSSFKVASLGSSTGELLWRGDHYSGEFSIIANKEHERCDLINDIPLESYINTLLTKEMNRNWPSEALKAQAVAARTYALYKMSKENKNKFFHVENSEKHQVNGLIKDTNENTLRATTETAGQVLVGINGENIPIFFHSKCGGHTRLPEEVWHNSIAGYEKVECKFCYKHGKQDWARSMPVEEFKSLIAKVSLDKMQFKQNENLMMIPDQMHRSELKYYYRDTISEIKKAHLRNTFGRDIFPSNQFQVSKKSDRVEIKGNGYGHGVGLCQFGAYELAKRGYTYKEILSYYFPKFKIKKIY